MNNIESKVASAIICKSIFVHPSLSAQSALSAIYKCDLVGFNLHGVEYFISPLSDDNIITGSTSSFTALINDGNTWHEISSLYLYSYEWYFLTGGVDLVNKQVYFNSIEKSRFITESELNKDIERWENEDKTMVDYLIKRHIPVTMSYCGTFF